MCMCIYIYIYIKYYEDLCDDAVGRAAVDVRPERLARLPCSARRCSRPVGKATGQSGHRAVRYAEPYRAPCFRTAAAGCRTRSGAGSS